MQMQSSLPILFQKQDAILLNKHEKKAEENNLNFFISTAINLWNFFFT